MGKAIERKYLVQSDAWRQQSQSQTQIRQGYLATEKERNVRVRLEDGERAFVMVKGKQKGRTCAEFEYPLPVVDARHMLDMLCFKPLILKTRHKIPVNGHTWVIDEFGGENSPLVVAKIETPSDEPPTHLPDWLGEEVTDDRRYHNANLVAQPYRTWAGKPEQETNFRFKRSESVGKGVERIVHEELTAAKNSLNQQSACLEESVHAARKSVKKLRAILRLMRPVLGADFRQKDHQLRDVGRKLAGVRDAHAILETFDQVCEEHCQELDRAYISGLRQVLVAQKQTEEEQFASTDQIPLVLEMLQQIQEDAQTWPYRKLNSRLIAKRVGATIRQGRKQFQVVYADPSAENFHEWRKHAKALRYQLTLLEKLWPDVFVGYRTTAATLEEQLGTDHNLAVLGETLRSNPVALAAEEAMQTFLPILEQEQQAIRSETETLGAHLYSETPKQWQQRIQQNWDVWKQKK